MQNTRDALITKATELFLGKGYGVVGTAEICRESKLNKGTFYHFFPSKSALGVAAIEIYANNFANSFSVIATSNMEPREKLKALFSVPAEANRTWKEKYGFAQGCLVGNMATELGTVDLLIKEATQAAINLWMIPIESVIADLIACGVLPKIDTRKGAEAVIVMLQGGLVLAKAFNDPARVATLSEAALPALAYC
jgi:TetR/AcrR family transcriptional regulator, transcriptional repressor for nem operon